MAAAATEMAAGTTTAAAMTTDPVPGHGRRIGASAALVLVVAVQSIATLFFVWDIVAGVFGLRAVPIAWETRELIEMGAALGLVLGVALGAALLVVTLRRNRRIEGQLRRTSAVFAELLEQRFGEWRLTPSERDVAWFTLKGMSLAEIARLRQTSEGTVKAQSNAIYRKAGVGGRTQLLSLFLEDLMEETPAARVASPAARARTVGGQTVGSQTVDGRAAGGRAVSGPP